MFSTIALLLMLSIIYEILIHDLKNKNASFLFVCYNSFK